MNRAETAKLLSTMAAYDKRIIGKIDVLAWHDILEPYRYEDAVVALREHLTESSEYVLPAHIVAGCRRIGNDRHQRALPAADESWVPCPPNAEYLAAKAEMIRKSAEKMKNI